jgi:trans-aconitate 2-methyltransferase
MSGFDGWDPDQYNRFSAEREQPWRDLVGLLHQVPRPTLADLGCGDGRLTSQLHASLDASSTLGIDRSAAMISAAAARAAPGLTFEAADVGTWEQPGTFDVIVANASLQWVPDHPAVLARWSRSLVDGGQLAVQVPANSDHVAYRVAADEAAETFGQLPDDPVKDNVLRPEEYAVLLDGLGFEQQHVRLQVYAHRLGSTGDVVEWLKGTTLTRFKERLGEQGWTAFLDRYRQRLLAEMGDCSPYLFTFKRILMWGRRA